MYLHLYWLHPWCGSTPMHLLPRGQVMGCPIAMGPTQHLPHYSSPSLRANISIEKTARKLARVSRI